MAITCSADVLWCIDLSHEWKQAPSLCWFFFKHRPLLSHDPKAQQLIELVRAGYFLVYLESNVAYFIREGPWPNRKCNGCNDYSSDVADGSGICCFLRGKLREYTKHGRNTTSKLKDFEAQCSRSTHPSMRQMKPCAASCEHTRLRKETHCRWLPAMLCCMVGVHHCTIVSAFFPGLCSQVSLDLLLPVFLLCQKLVKYFPPWFFKLC